MLSTIFVYKKTANVDYPAAVSIQKLGIKTRKTLVCLLYSTSFYFVYFNIATASSCAYSYAREIPSGEKVSPGG